MIASLVYRKQGTGDQTRFFVSSIKSITFVKPRAREKQDNESGLKISPGSISSIQTARLSS